MIIENNEIPAAPPRPPAASRTHSHAGALLEELYRPIARDLAQTERILRAELRSPVEFIAELTERVRLYEGKRIRPALLLLTARACGKVTPDHHTLAAVVEMIHAATLVHDDVLDEADVRRHISTVNAEWGSEASVLLGDYLFTHAFHLAASLESTLACRMIGRSTNRVCEGELNQVARQGCFELSEEEYYSIIDGKTAELIACCCGLGAHFAGADRDTVAAMSGYGRDLGIAFQIADDLLDLLSESSTTGKTSGCDLAKQKPTLPLIRFRSVASAVQVARCREAFEHPGPDQRRAVLEMLAATDALDYARRTALRHADDASRRLDALPPSDARDRLAQIARMAVERTA